VDVVRWKKESRLMKNVWFRASIVISVVASGPVLLIACDHDEHAEHAKSGHDAVATERERSAAPARAGDVASARESIVAARCDREERCSNIGAGKDYETRDACSSKLDGKTGSDLNTEDCARGVDRPKLSACLSKIRTEDCGNPIDSLSRFAACRTGEICIGS
jgi:hypothetical protein